MDEPSTFSGATTVTAGSVHVTDSAALGATTSGTTVSSGAELWVDAGGLNLPEALIIGGTGLGPAGALNISTVINSTWSGPITASANTLLTAEAP